MERTRWYPGGGIDARGNYSSAADLATITREAMKHPEFRKIVEEPEATISTQAREIDIFTTNLLEGKPIPLYGDGLNERDIIGPTNYQGIEYSHGWNPALQPRDGAPSADDVAWVAS